MNTRLKISTNDSYLDQTNLNDKVQEHQNSEQELNANKQRIDEVLDSGIQLKESGHDQSERIQSKLDEIFDSLQTQQYFATANEAEPWLQEKEPLAGNADYGKKEDASEALLKNHDTLMSDLEAFEIQLRT